MRKHHFFFLLLMTAYLVSNCNHTDRSAFEKASGIAIPPGAREKESHDDGKLVKINSFQSDSFQLTALIKTHQFIPLSREKISQLWGMTYLTEKPDFSNLASFHYISGTSGNETWMYIADVSSGMLWTEIKYKGKPSY